jgi:hypothetical protein
VRGWEVWPDNRNRLVEAEMNSTALQVHKSWLRPAVLVLVLTGLADCIAVWFAKRPILWSTVIASTLPISLFFFVALPILRQESRKS